LPEIQLEIFMYLNGNLIFSYTQVNKSDTME